MAYVAEEAVWKEGVYQLETSDPVLGGPNGVSNKNIKDLACRTLWLKRQVDTLLTYADGNDDAIADIYNTLLGIQGNLSYIFGLLGNVEDYLKDLNTIQSGVLTLDAAVEVGEQVTLPDSMKYYVDSNSLQVFWQGVKCAEDRQYVEGVGDDDGLCDYVTALFNMRKGSQLEFWVTGHSTQVIDGSGGDTSGWGDNLVDRLNEIEKSIKEIQEQLMMRDASEIFEETLEEK